MFIQLVIAVFITVPVAAFVILAARRPGGVELRVAGDVLHIDFKGVAPSMVMHRRLTIPVSSVQGVAVAPRRLVPETGLRLGGTAIPGVLRAGTYGMAPERDLWFVRQAAEVLVIQLEPGEPFRRIVLELPNPRTEAQRLRPTLGFYVGSFSE